MKRLRSGRVKSKPLLLSSGIGILCDLGVGLVLGAHLHLWGWVGVGVLAVLSVGGIVAGMRPDRSGDQDKGVSPNAPSPQGSQGDVTQNIVQTGEHAQTIGQQNIGQQFNMSPVPPQQADVVHKNAEFSYNDGNGLETNGLTVETEGIKAIGNKGSGAVHNGPVRDRNSEYGYNGIGGMFLGPGSGPRPAESQVESTGRNEACRCGSGKKSKFCCG